VTLHCACPRGGAPCGHAITQEDLLCDECRRGDCADVTTKWVDGEGWRLVRVDGQPPRVMAIRPEALRELFGLS
jgi:hypothetical protein